MMRALVFEDTTGRLNLQTFRATRILANVTRGGVLVLRMSYENAPSREVGFPSGTWRSYEIDTVGPEED